MPSSGAGKPGIVAWGAERWVEQRRDRETTETTETTETRVTRVTRAEKDRSSSAGLTAYRKPETLPALAHNYLAPWTDFAWQKSNYY